MLASESGNRMVRKWRFLTSRRRKAEKLVQELGPDVIFANVDVTNEASAINGIQKTIGAFGAIHIAINCAGTGNPTKVLSKKGPHPLDAFNKIVQINLIGTFNVIRLCGGTDGQKRGRCERREGCGSSIPLLLPHLTARIGQAAYSATKAAIVRHDASHCPGMRRIRHTDHDHLPWDFRYAAFGQPARTCEGFPW